MGQTVKVDYSETRVILDALTNAIRVAPAAAMAAVTKGALNIKMDARRRVSGHKYLPAYPNAITFDTYVSLSGPSAVIGPDKARPQGALGNLLEFGSSKNAPIPHMLPAAEAEEPKFVAALEALAVKALGQGFS